MDIWKLFCEAYYWLYGERPDYDEYSTAYMQAVIDAWNNHTVKAFYED